MAETSSTSSKPPFDNFYSPQNDEFYKASLYRNLDKSSRQLRLIRLFAGEHDDPLRCELVDNLDLDSARSKYVAISYYAGDPNDTVVITVNGINFNAFATLGHAIRHVRLSAESLSNMGHEGESQLLWTDQICINQSDPSERAHQVGLMKDIYEGAGRVLVWLGGESSDGQGLKFLNYQLENVNELVEGVLADADDDEKDKNDPEAIRDYAYERIGETIAEDLHDETFVTNWMGVRELILSPWWTRCWVAQELIVSRASALVLGPSAMRWDEFRIAFAIVTATMKAIIRNVFDSSVVPDGEELRHLRSMVGEMDTAHIKFMIQRQKDWETGNSKELIPLLHHCRTCKSSDPRDRIYAFLGLADPEYTIIPSYDGTNTIENTLSHTAKRIILHERNLDILSSAQEQDRPENPDLPSWVPDWRNPLDRRRLSETDYKASGCYMAVSSFHARLDGTPDRVLRTACLLVDQLATSPTTIMPPHPTNTLGRSVERWLPIAGTDLHRPTEEEEKYPHTGESNREALLGVLYLGQDRDMPGAPSNPDGPQQQGQEEEGQVEILRNRHLSSVETVCNGDFVFFKSAQGYLGLADSRSLHTDVIAVILGASVPYILRKVGSHYRLIGEAYVHGLMNGEAIQRMSKGELEVEMVDIM